MGAAISAAREQANEADEKAKQRTKEQLDFLVNVANNRLDQFQNDIEEMFMDPASMEKKAVPGMRALRWERGYRVGVTNGASQGLSDIVDGFFGIASDATDSNKDGNTKKNDIISGFKNIVKTGLNGILGNTNAGQQEEQKFFIFMKENAVVRIDVKIWRYNFSGDGIMAKTENVFCYIFCTSVVDSAKMKMDEFSYLLSEYAGDQGVKAYVDHLIEIWTSIAKMQKFINQSRLDIELQAMHLGGTQTKTVEHETTVTHPLAITAT